MTNDAIKKLNRYGSRKGWGKRAAARLMRRMGKADAAAKGGTKRPWRAGGTA